MEISTPNQYGAMKATHNEIVARHGRCYAAVNVALCEDGLYRISTSMQYGHGGFGGPVFLETPAYPTVAAAINAGPRDLLRHWHTPFSSEPQSVQDELNDMRQQIEARLTQPTLF